MPYRKEGVDLDLVLNKISDGISVHDSEWRYIYANERTAEMSGLPLETIVGKTIWEVYPELRKSDLWHACQQAALTMEKRTAIYASPHTQKWLETDIYPAEGSITLITRDITEREVMLGRIKSAYEQLHLVTDAVPALISYVDRDYHYRYANKAYEEWFKINSSDLVGMHIRDVVGHEVFEAARPNFELAFKGQPISFDRKHVYRPDLIKYVHVDYVPDIDAEGNVRGAVVLVHDQTDYQRTLESKVVSDERLKMALKNVPLVLSHNDLDLRYTWYADPLARYEAAEVLGKRAADILPKDAAEKIDETRHAAMTTLSFQSTELTTEIDGEKHYFDIRTEPSFDAGGQLNGTTTAALDTTLWRRNEERLQLLSRMSEKLSASLTDPDVLQSVTELATESFADYCAVTETTDEGAISVLASACNGYSCKSGIPQLISKYVLSQDSDGASVMKTGKPLFIPHLSEELVKQYAESKDRSQLTCECHLRSVISVPLQSRGEIIGALTFALCSKRAFKDGDVDFALLLGRRIAAAVDNGRLYRSALQEIEERKRAEAEKFELAMTLEAERERLSNILASVPGVVYESHGEPGEPDHRIVFVSDNMREWTGVSPEDLVRDPALWMADVPDDELPRIFEQLRSIPSSQDHGMVSYKMRLKDGSLIDVDSHFRTLYDNEGKRIRRCGVLMDVTDRIRTEHERAKLQQELDRERLRLREIMESVPGAVYETVGMPGTPEYHLEYISPYVEQMLGYKSGELIDDPLFWVHCSPKEYREETLEQLRNFPPNTDTGSFSLKWQHKNGRIFDVETFFRTRRDASGNIVGRTGVIMDVTDRLRAERELGERRDQLARLISNIPGMAYRCLTVKGWPFEYASSGCFEFTGYPVEDFLVSGERRWFDLINPDDLPEIDRVVEDCIERNAPVEVTYRIRHASGEERSVLDRAVVVRNEKGEIIAFEGICIDITEIKRAQQAIIQANQAKDQFIAALSHELRTPLTPVLTCIEILKFDERLPEDPQPMIEIIERNINLESRLIDDLLDLTRIIRGKIHLEKKVIDLHSLVYNAIDICSGRIKEKQLELKIALGAQKAAINCDPARMQQVLWNLIQNAAKFTPAKGVISIRTWNSAQDEIFLSVEDTGIGMQDSQLLRIFNPFEQGTPTITKRFGGLGLGLAISQRIVELHGGSIVAFSEGEGKGATFTVTLPLMLAESTISNSALKAK